MILSKH